MESLESIRQNFANNLSSLRRQSGMTQLELAERLKYSDKAISKWERGESVPDVGVLKYIADTFGVDVDYLIESEHKARERESAETLRVKTRNRTEITLISVAVVWLVALTAYVTASMATNGKIHLWLAFIYAVPISSIVWLVFNSIWFNRRRNFLIVSILIWTVLISLFITLIPVSAKAWQLLLLGIPGQTIVFFWSRIKVKGKKVK